MPRQKPTDRSNLLQSQLGRGAATESSLFRLIAGVQTPLVLKGGLHPEQIRVVALEEPPPLTLRDLSIGEQTFQKTQGTQAPAHTLRPGKEVGRRQALALQSSLQQIRRQGLPDQILKQNTHPSCRLS